MLACLLIKYCKEMTAYPGCAGLARSPFVLTEHISSKYIYMYGGTYAIIVVHATYM